MSDRTDSQLSVIVSSRDNGDLAACIESLASQRNVEVLQIIAVMARSERWRLPAGICIVQTDAPLDGGAQRNAGLACAHGRWIAFLPSYLTVPTDWASRVLDAHREWPSHVLIGSIVNDNPGNAIACADFICERNRWLAPRMGRLPNAPSVNASYERRVFSSDCRFPEIATEADIAFHKHLRTEQGLELLGVPTIEAHYRAADRFDAFLHHQYQEGRRFTRLRRERGALGFRTRLLIYLGWWLIPFRMAHLTLRETRDHGASRSMFWQRAPLVLAGWLARAVGEARECVSPFSRRRGGRDDAPPMAGPT